LRVDAKKSTIVKGGVKAGRPVRKGNVNGKTDGQSKIPPGKRRGKKDKNATTERRREATKGEIMRGIGYGKILRDMKENCLKPKLKDKTSGRESAWKEKGALPRENVLTTTINLSEGQQTGKNLESV